MIIKLYFKKVLIDIRNLFYRIRYNFFVYKEAYKFLKKWQKFDPELFKLQGKSQKSLFNTFAESFAERINPLDKDISVLPHSGRPNDLINAESVKEEIEELSQEFNGH